MGQVYIFSFFLNYNNLDLIFPLDRDQGSWNYFPTVKTNTISVVIMATGTLYIQEDCRESKTRKGLPAVG